jgi:hypothetical protein
MTEDIHPAFLGQFNVRDDKAEVVFIDQIQGFRGRGRGLYFVALFLEDDSEKVKDALLVVNNEYFFRFSLLFLEISPWSLRLFPKAGK